MIIIVESLLSCIPQICKETNALLVFITQTFTRGSDGKCTRCSKTEGDHYTSGGTKFCFVSTTSTCPPPHVYGFVLFRGMPTIVFDIPHARQPACVLNGRACLRAPIRGSDIRKRQTVVCCADSLFGLDVRRIGCVVLSSLHVPLRTVFHESLLYLPQRCMRYCDLMHAV